MGARRPSRSTLTVFALGEVILSALLWKAVRWIQGPGLRLSTSVLDCALRTRQRGKAHGSPIRAPRIYELPHTLYSLTHHPHLNPYV